MFLHLGGEVTVLQRDVIGIFSIDISKTGPATKEYLELIKSEKKLIVIGENQEIKSFVITNESVFFSPISSTTLQKRSQSSLYDSTGQL